MAIKSHCFSTWILQALQEAVSFQPECICVNAMKEPSSRYLGEYCVCMSFVTGFSNCEEKMSVALCSNSFLTFSGLVQGAKASLCQSHTERLVSVGFH